MRRQQPDGFAVFFVHEEIFPRGFIGYQYGSKLGVLPQHAADQGADIGPVGDVFCYDILGTLPCIAFRFHAFFRVDKGRGQFSQAFGCIRLQHDITGQRLQPFFPGNLGAGPFFRPVGQVQVFQYLHFFCRQYLLFQFRRQLFLLPDGVQYFFPARVQITEILGPCLQITDLFFVQRTGSLFPVPGNKRNGVSVVQQLQRGFCLSRFDIQFFG